MKTDDEGMKTGDEGMRSTGKPAQVLDPSLWDAITAIEWLNLSEAAALIGVTVGTIHEACKTGRLPAISSAPGSGHRAWLIPRVEAEHYRDTRGRGGKAGRSGARPQPGSRRTLARLRREQRAAAGVPPTRPQATDKQG
jgi:hypothetical protein